MDFAFSEEQRMFRDMFADFASNEIAPKAEEIDKAEAVPPDMLRQLADQGFLAATLPERYLGADLDMVSYALLIEALAKESLSLAVLLAVHVGETAMAILDHGSEEQREEWLPRLAEGDVIGAFAVTEPDSGCDTRVLSTTARREGDNVVLNGVKCWIANGDIAGLVLVFAAAPEGIEAYLMPADTPGLTVGYREPTLGLRSVTFNTLYLEDCWLPISNRLGGTGEGGEVYCQAQNRMALSLAAAGLGVAEGSIEVASDFAAQRIQFGIPIARKQAIQGYIGDAAVELEALRALVYRTAWVASQGHDLGYEASIAKTFGARVARDVTNAMVQVMGGYGYMEDYPMARKYRDARMLGIVGGPTELHRLQVASNFLVPRDIEVTY